MKNYVGRKIRGFKFEDVRNNVLWFGYMENYIGEIGEITYENSVRVRVKFKDTAFDYPISLIEPHLIEECTCENINDTCDYCEVIQDSNILQDAKDRITTPEIPQLGEGILMMVSDDGIEWSRNYVSAITFGGRYVGSWNTWKYASPIPQLPKYTHAELVEKLGEDFIYEK